MGRPPNPNTPQPISSPEDADLQALWWSNCHGYPRRWFFVPEGGREMFFMHRLIMARVVGRPLLTDEEVDHINGDRLDNRRENLRIVTSLQNSQNRHCDGPFRGTGWVKSRGKWRSHVSHKGKVVVLGLFDTQEEAARVSAAKRIELGFLNPTRHPSKFLETIAEP